MLNTECKLNEGLNLDDLKQELRGWHDSGGYYMDIQEVMDKAKKIVDEYVKMEKCSVIFDIDETLISEYKLMIENDFGWSEAVIDEAQTRTDFPAIPEVQELFNYCKNKSINIFILSSKRERYRGFVIKELINSGYSGYNELILRPDDDKGTIQKFKLKKREELLAKGYNILLNIGDQWSDLHGGGSIYSIKIPNRFYSIGDNV